MDQDNSSNLPTEDKKVHVVQAGSMEAQLALASQVPFILRSWWLRDFAEYADFPFYRDISVTGTVWSEYSDPMCDVGNLDRP